MARIEISSVSNPYGTGELQLQGKVAMSGTLTAVTDNLNTASPLKLSTGGVQVASTLQITTNSNPYIDAEDGAGNNRFTVGRDPSSQVVNVDFASNPTGGTNMVGGIRTYTDGVNLAQVMSFRKDGNVGIGTTSPILKTEIQSSVDGQVTTITSPYWNLYLSSQYTSAGMKLGLNGQNTGAIIQGTGNPNGTSPYGLMLNPFGGNATFGTLNDLGSKLAIRGSGSTSATTSLLVQRSSGDTIFQVQDDGSCTFGQSGSGSTATFYGNTGLQCRIGNSYFESPPSIIRVSGGQLTFWNQNNNANGFSFEHNNSQQTNASGVSMINLGGAYYTQQNAQFSSLQIVPSYDLNANTTTNSIARGIYYNPTITNLRVAQHRAIETTTGDVLLNTTSGNTLIGSGASNTAKLSIKGTGSTSATNSLYMLNSSGARLFQIQDDGTINTSYTAPFYINFLLVVMYDITARGLFGNSGALNLGGQGQGNASATMVNIAGVGSPASGTIGTSLQISPFGLQSAVHIGVTYNGNYTSSVGANTLIGYDFSPTNYGASATLRAFQSSVGGAYLNTTSYNASAILQADSTTQGFLPPRMTDAQVRAIVSPAVGLMAYNTDLDCPVFYSSAGWRKVSHSAM